MRVLLSTYGSRGDVEPMVGLAVRLRALGAEVRRSDGGRDAATRRDQPRKAANVRVNHEGSSSQAPEHENLQTLAT
jgi:hypothetical protein